MQVMDLEDSVAVGEKDIARKNVIQALKDMWVLESKPMCCYSFTA